MTTDTEKTDDLLTINALATLHKVDRRTVERRLEGIEPVRTRQVGDRTLKFYRNAEVRDLILAPSDAKAIAEAYEELHAVRADILAMRRSLRVREYVDRKDVEDVLANAYRAARDRMLGLADKTAPLVAGLIDKHGSDRKALQAAFEAVWQREVDEIMQDLHRPRRTPGSGRSR